MQGREGQDEKGSGRGKLARAVSVAKAKCFKVVLGRRRQ